MATPIWVFSSESDALEQAQQLIALGVPIHDIRLVQFAPRQEDQKRIGTFNDEDARESRVGAFDNTDTQQQPQGSYDDTQDHQHTLDEPHTGRYDDTDPPVSLAATQHYHSYQAAALALTASGVAPSAIPPTTTHGYIAILLPPDAPYLSDIEHTLAQTSAGRRA